MTTVLISRPKEDAEELAADLRRDFPDLAIVVAPAISIVSVPFDLGAQKIDAVLLTSKHAVGAAVRYFPDAIALCVGEATAKAAQHAGLRAQAASGTAAGLVEYVLGLGFKRVAYLHGEHTVGDVDEKLISAGIETLSAVVYHQLEQNLDAATIRTLEAATSLVVPVYSPRSARIVSNQLQACSSRIKLVAISEQAARAWEGQTPAEVEVSTVPTAKAMYAAIASQLDRTA